MTSYKRRKSSVTGVNMHLSLSVNCTKSYQLTLGKSQQILQGMPEYHLATAIPEE